MDRERRTSKATILKEHKLINEISAALIVIAAIAIIISLIFPSITNMTIGCSPAGASSNGCSVPFPANCWGGNACVSNTLASSNANVSVLAHVFQLAGLIRTLFLAVGIILVVIALSLEFYNKYVLPK